MNNDVTLQHEIEQFLFAEARCIDEQRWSDWLDLFDNDADYWIPLSHDDVEPGHGLSILYEDRPKLELRCRRYAHPLIHAQSPPSRCCHLVSNVSLGTVSDAGKIYTVYATFQVSEYRMNRSVHWMGSYEYQLTRSGNELKIKRKKVTLVNSEGELEAIQLPL